jgi:hypothetical protein
VGQEGAGSRNLGDGEPPAWAPALDVGASAAGLPPPSSHSSPRARADSSSPGRSSKACAEPANRRGASGGPGRPIGAARWPTGATLRPVAHPRWRIGAAAACSVEPAAVWTWRPRVWDERDGPIEIQIRLCVFVLLHLFFDNYNLVHSFF